NGADPAFVIFLLLFVQLIQSKVGLATTSSFQPENAQRPFHQSVDCSAVRMPLSQNLPASSTQQIAPYRKFVPTMLENLHYLMAFSFVIVESRLDLHKTKPCHRQQHIDST